MMFGSLWRGALVAAAVALAGCGDGGDPDFYAQVQYRLVAVGGDACFALDYIASSGARHEVPAGRVFSLANGDQASFLLANAPPPYEGVFDWVACPNATGTITVSAFEVQGPSAAPQTLSATQPRVSMRLRQDADAPLATEIESPRARFELCAPTTKDGDCSEYIVGKKVTGSIGDAKIAHDLRPLEGDDSLTMPAMLFLERPRNQVTGIFRGEPDQTIRGELYVDDDLEDDDNSTGNDVVVDYQDL